MNITRRNFIKLTAIGTTGFLGTYLYSQKPAIAQASNWLSQLVAETVNAPMGYFVAGGGIVASQQFGANQTDVFSVDQSGQLNVFWVVGEGVWQGPLTISPAGIANPGSFIAASQQFGTNQTDVFLVDKNGQLNLFWVVGEGVWNGPFKLGPAGIANPGSFIAASQQFGANQTDVFLVDKNGQLNLFWVVGEGVWNGPFKLGPAGIANPGSFIAAS
ncbi:MAG: hypothetical protein ACYT04_40800, partial [Nostoc sp.]